jgi:WD40 repeat protein
MAAILDQFRPEPGQIDLREFTWRLLSRQARNDMWIRGHRDAVRDVAWSADGRTLASLSHDRTVRITDPTTGRLRTTINEHGVDPTWMAMAPGGDCLAILYRAGNESYRLGIWDTRTGARQATLDDDQVAERRPTFAPNGETLAVPRIERASNRGAVLLWDFRTGGKRYLLEELSDCSTIGFSVDGRLIAAACQDHAKTEATTIHVVDLSSGGTIAKLAGNRRATYSIVFTPDGKSLITGGHDGTVRIWDLVAGKERACMEFDDEAVYNAALANDSKWIVAVSEVYSKRNTRVRVFDLQTGDGVLPTFELPCLAWNMAMNSREGRYALACQDRIVRVRRIEPEPLVVQLPGHEKETWAVGFTPDNKTLISTSDDHSVAVWDIATGAKRLDLMGHDSLASCLAIAPAGARAYSGGYDGKAIVWDLANGKRLHTLEGHSSPLRAISLSPNGSRLATGGRDRKLLLWDAHSGKQIAEWQDHTDEIRAIAFTLDGKHRISGGHDQNVIVREIESGAQVARFRNPDEVWSIAVHPDGRSLIIGGKDGVPRVWDIFTGQQRDVIGGHAAQIYCVAVSPDGRTIASAGMDRTIRLWHLPTGGELCCLKSISSDARGVAFSPDGRMLAAGLHDGKVLCWTASGLD